MREPMWMLATFIFPVVVSLMGLTAGRLMPLDKEKYGKKTSLWSQFRDGQLGWISVAWSIGAIYEIKHFPGRADYLDYMEAGAYFLTFWGTMISAAGAIEADPEGKTNWVFVLSSAAIAAFSGYVFYNAHVYIEDLDKTGAIIEKMSEHEEWCLELQRTQPLVQCPGRN